MYTLPLNHSHDCGIWDSGAKLSVRHFVSVKAFLLSKGRRRRCEKDYGINLFLTMEAVKVTKAQPC
jgi:hypothetical protein